MLPCDTRRLDARLLKPKRVRCIRGRSCATSPFAVALNHNQPEHASVSLPRESWRFAKKAVAIARTQIGCCPSPPVPITICVVVLKYPRASARALRSRVVQPPLAAKLVFNATSRPLSARSPEPHKSQFLTQSQCKLNLLATPDVELLVSALKPDDVAYNLYVEMVTFQPGSCRWISELQSVEL